MEKTNKSPLAIIIILAVIVVAILIFARARRAPGTGQTGGSTPSYDTQTGGSETTQGGGTTVSTGNPMLDSEIQALDAIIGQTNPDDFSDDTLAGIE